jgi:polyisoprenoid-binding protein YceI
MHVSRTAVAAVATLAVGLVASFRSAPAPAATAAPASVPVLRVGTFQIDAVHSAVIFRIRHLGVSYSYGRFNGIGGTFTTAEDPGQASVQVDIDAKSIDTGNAQRDEHLRSPDFFNVVQYPKITFESKRITKKGDAFAVTGDLSLHGETREVTVDMRFIGERDAGERFGYRAGFEGSFTVNRRDYGISTFPTEVLGEEVEVTVSLEGVKK